MHEQDRLESAKWDVWENRQVKRVMPLTGALAVQCMHEHAWLESSNWHSWEHKLGALLCFRQTGGRQCMQFEVGLEHMQESRMVHHQVGKAKA
jgi:hypothetical protein